MRASRLVRRVLAFAASFKTRPRLAAGVGALCIAGVAYGFAYYAPQLARTPLPLWPFAPDTPLAALWAALALALYWAHRRRGGVGERPGVPAATLDAAAFVANLQVGAWAVFVLVAYRTSFSAPGQSPWLLLLVSHVGMVLLAFVFADGVRARWQTAPRAQAGGIAIASAFYLAQDALDYFGPDHMGRGCAMRPHTVPCDPHVEALLATLTFALTVGSVGLLVALARPPARA